ncbi:MAG: putative lipoprotein [Flavipsychrobacter sp.]|nr:putative lipoprotein [Flavipsychrobacter sp.]
MNRYTSIIPIIVCCLAAAACNNAVNNKTTSNEKVVSGNIANAAWLVGKWQKAIDSGVITETWSKKDDSTYTGTGYFIKGGDTLFSENIVLEQKGTNMYYIPTVKGQNNDKPIPFTLTSMSDKVMVFENPAHDFPQKISYTRVGDDSLLAEVSGVDHGQVHTEPFAMARVK